MATINIRGDIVGNDDKWIYEWFGVEATCPKDVKDILDGAEKSEPIDVLINSGGGSVFAGQEMYSILQGDDRVTIKIQSMAGSAAGVVAMAGRCLISPVAMIMIHNVSVEGVSGDYHDMQKNAEILKQVNAAMASAYTKKSGRSLEEILKLMDRETWMTANQCLEYGFVDGILSDQKPGILTNAYSGMWLTEEIRKKAIQERAAKEKEKADLLNDIDLYGI